MDYAIRFPRFSPGELVADRLVHVIGVAVASLAVPVLVAIAAQRDDGLIVAGVLVYGLGALAMLVSSALYNLTKPSRRKELLRRLDHSAIFVMIAGTYTPLLLCKIGGVWGVALLAYVWLVAIGGVAVKLAFPRRFERVSIGLYLALGWTVLPIVVPLAAALSTPAIVLIAAGGFLYTFGVLIHLWRRLPYHNAIWHALVFSAAACHYIVVLNAVVLAAPLT